MRLRSKTKWILDIFYFSPPGQFEIGREQIADLGVGVGVLDVSIYEKNGQVQNYTVPYSTPVLSLPDGYSKYSVIYW
ncbi:fimbria/pilus outer membrane usher protein [Salmonella enterica]|uniref:fimbria/pilus outer membrane usher protein n=1 Tax=Salmonella enterica TaxID=28901 RepID=UPI002453702D|nr:fimbria/pilus outer membrane usher protein [Salmonella enterica]